MNSVCSANYPHSLWVGRRKRLLPFPRRIAWSETQTTSCWIRTRLVYSISYNDSRYGLRDPRYTYKLTQTCIYGQFLSRVYRTLRTRSIFKRSLTGFNLTLKTRSIFKRSLTGFNLTLRTRSIFKRSLTGFNLTLRSRSIFKRSLTGFNLTRSTRSIFKRS